MMLKFSPYWAYGGLEKNKIFLKLVNLIDNLACN